MFFLQIAFITSFYSLRKVPQLSPPPRKFVVFFMIPLIGFDEGFLSRRVYPPDRDGREDFREQVQMISRKIFLNCVHSMDPI